MSPRAEHPPLPTPEKDTTDYGALFDSLIEQLSKRNQELGEQWEEKLDKQISNGVLTQEQACRQLEEVIALRMRVENTGRRKEAKHATQELIIKGRTIALDYVRAAVSNPDRFLGNGATATVANIMPGVCAKVIHEFEKYREGNNVQRERLFLDEVRDLAVEGVRAPKAYYIMRVLDSEVLLMEELDAVCLARVLEGKDNLPDTFDCGDFFRRLNAYIAQLHKQGIYHLDIAARNIMADRKTGLPYVIDFGKSVLKTDILGERFGELSEINMEKDRACCAQTKAKMDQFLEEKGLKKAS